MQPKKFKQGQIKAIKIGRNDVIPKKNLGSILGKSLAKKDRDQIAAAIKKTIAEYGQTLRLLGKD